MFYPKRFFEFMEEYRDMPHKSIWHYVSYYDHIYGTIKNCRDSLIIPRALVLACAFHDIAKPRTLTVLPDGSAAFYGHWDVSEDELSIFIDKSDRDFKIIHDLIVAHILPYAIRGPEPISFKAKEKLNEFYQTHKPVHPLDRPTTGDMLRYLHNFDVRANRPISQKEVNELKDWIVRMYDY